jgi:hypothetical protein
MASPVGDNQSGGYKRPAQTIEGTATEVAFEPETETRAESEAADPRSDDANHAGADDGLPPPRATLPELKSFVTHLAAGLLGGLIGVVALAFAWGALNGAGSGPSSEIAELESRIAKLETTPAASAVDADALSKLDSRIAVLEGSAKQSPADLSDLSARVAKLESSLKSLADAAEQGGSVGSAAAVDQQIAEAEQRLDAKIAEALAKGESANSSALAQLQTDLSDLKAKIGALAEAQLGDGNAPGDVGAELNALSDRIAKLETSLPELAGAIGKDSASVKSAATAIAFANLRAAVSDGRPYAAELDTIGALAPDGTDLGVLPSYAEKGIPTLPDLMRAFAATREGVLAPSTPPAASDTLMGSLMASAQSLVKIKRLDEPGGGEGPGAALARAQGALDKGDLEGAVKDVETLDGVSREAFSGWLGDAHARLSADEIMIRLENTLLVSMGEDTEAPQQ